MRLGLVIFIAIICASLCEPAEGMRARSYSLDPQLLPGNFLAPRQIDILSETDRTLSPSTIDSAVFASGFPQHRVSITPSSCKITFRMGVTLCTIASMFVFVPTLWLFKYFYTSN